VPVCALSTGTNNAFPEMREATVAGLATGLVATGKLDAERTLRRTKVLRRGQRVIDLTADMLERRL